jgi:hypothetical protein
VINIATGPPRFSGGRKSETIAIPMLKPGLAKSPAKVLQTIKDAIFCENPAPRVKAATPGRAVV